MSLCELLTHVTKAEPVAGTRRQSNAVILHPRHDASAARSPDVLRFDFNAASADFGLDAMLYGVLHERKEHHWRKGNAAHGFRHGDAEGKAPFHADRNELEIA